MFVLKINDIQQKHKQHTLTGKLVADGVDNRVQPLLQGNPPRPTYV